LPFGPQRAQLQTLERVGQFIAKRMIRVPSEPGISHYGFVADDIEQVATELRGKTAELSREIRAPR